MVATTSRPGVPAGTSRVEPSGSVRTISSAGAAADGPSIIGAVFFWKGGHSTATEAGLAPTAVRRLLNIGGRFGPDRVADKLLAGPAEQWAEQLSELTLEHGFSSYILMADDATTLSVFGKEVAPAVREAVSAERGTS